MNIPPPSVNSLLSNLKSLVELLIQFRGDSLTTKYGAIERLRLAILPILSHGLISSSVDNYEQLWQIIVRLNANSQRYIHLLQDVFHLENIRVSVEQWIEQSVISQCLSQQISCAERDQDLLQQYYHSHAFIRMPQLYRAFLICIRTVEYSDPSLLIDIDPKLSITGFQTTDNGANQSAQTTKDDIQQRLHPLVQQNSFHRRIHSDPIFPIPKESTNHNRSYVATPPTPNSNSDLVEIRNKPPEIIPTVSYIQTEEYGSYASSYDSRGDIFDQNKQQKLTQDQSSNSDNTRQSISSQMTLTDERDSLYDHNDETVLSTTSTSPMERSTTISTIDYPTTKTSTRLPYYAYFQPRKGQTLDNYIRECDLQTRTDVEKENAHFYFSEAIMSAVEQIKFNQQCNKHFGQSWSSSNANLFSPCETTHASSSSSNISSSPPLQQYMPCNPKLLSKNLMINSSQSDLNSEIMESTTESNEPPNHFEVSTRSSILSSRSQESSAEAIALGLIDKWKNHKAPSVPDLFWMIPRDADLPQQILPLPVGISIDPSEDSISGDDGQRILCRGNNQWAPPREQLIFHIHPAVNRDVQLRKQGYLCAGCGRHVEKGYASRYRYCEYTGKYFCLICHSDRKSYLPSYIIAKWDFSNKHSVSNFAYDYLNRIFTDPSFNLNDLNPKLYEKSKKLKAVDELRWSLYYLRHYILTCRFAQEKDYQQMLQKLSTYMYTNPYMYSLHDLFKTKSGDLMKVLEPIVINLRDHVQRCPLCSAKGFVCEICRNTKDIIFPFQLETTSVCQTCQSCFHFQCHENAKYRCPKCQRNKSRNSIDHTSSINRSITPTNTPEDDLIT